MTDKKSTPLQDYVDVALALDGTDLKREMARTNNQNADAFIVMVGLIVLAVALCFWPLVAPVAFACVLVASWRGWLDRFGPPKDYAEWRSRRKPPRPFEYE